jgi:hypothetical protein
VFSGTAGDDHGLAAVTVNERQAEVRGGRFACHYEFAGEGVFPVSVVARDHGGNSTAARRTVVVSTDEPPRSRQAARFSPDGDGREDSVEFTIAVSWNLVGISARLLEIHSLDGEVLRSWQDADRAPGRYKWDGTDEQGRACPAGMYVAVFTVRDLYGRLREMYQPVLLER